MILEFTRRAALFDQFQGNLPGVGHSPAAQMVRTAPACLAHVGRQLTGASIHRYGTAVVPGNSHLELIDVRFLVRLRLRDDLSAEVPRLEKAVSIAIAVGDGNGSNRYVTAIIDGLPSRHRACNLRANVVLPRSAIAPGHGIRGGDVKADREVVVHRVVEIDAERGEIVLRTQVPVTEGKILADFSADKLGEQDRRRNHGIAVPLDALELAAEPETVHDVGAVHGGGGVKRIGSNEQPVRSRVLQRQHAIGAFTFRSLVEVLRGPGIRKQGTEFRLIDLFGVSKGRGGRAVTAEDEVRGVIGAR